MFLYPTLSQDLHLPHDYKCHNYDCLPLFLKDNRWSSSVFGFNFEAAFLFGHGGRCVKVLYIDIVHLLNFVRASRPDQLIPKENSAIAQDCGDT